MLIKNGYGLLFEKAQTKSDLILNESNMLNKKTLINRKK